MRKLLVIDGDAEAQQSFCRIFDSPGLQVTVASDLTSGIPLVADVRPEVVVMDLGQGADASLEGLRRLREQDRRLPVVVITSGDAIHIATEAIRLGAYNYLLKPFDIPKLQEVVLAALEAARAMNEVLSFDASAEPPATWCCIGASPAMRRSFEMVNHLAAGDAPVLITGEPGSGKRLIARAIYQASARNQQLLLTVNCAAIPQALLESELFGNEKAAFPPFLTERIGRFEQCDQGTLLLHEIGALPLPLQAKVARLVQTGVVERSEGEQSGPMRVRLIATSSKCPDPAAAPQHFDPALLALPNLALLRLPPLRDRKADIRPLAKHFLKQACNEPWERPRSLSPKAFALLERYHWPGNIRELREVILKALASAKGDPILPSDLPSHLRSFAHAEAQNGAPADLQARRRVPTLNSEELARMARKLFVWARTDSDLKIIPAIERELVINALVETKGNQLHAARLLGITRATLRKRVARFRIGQELSFG